MQAFQQVPLLPVWRTAYPNPEASQTAEKAGRLFFAMPISSWFSALLVPDRFQPAVRLAIMMSTGETAKLVATIMMMTLTVATMTVTTTTTLTTMTTLTKPQMKKVMRKQAVKSAVQLVTNNRIRPRPRQSET